MILRARSLVISDLPLPLDQDLPSPVIREWSWKKAQIITIKKNRGKFQNQGTYLDFPKKAGESSHL